MKSNPKFNSKYNADMNVLRNSYNALTEDSFGLFCATEPATTVQGAFSLPGIHFVSQWGYHCLPQSGGRALQSHKTSWHMRFMIRGLQRLGEFFAGLHRNHMMIYK